MAKITTIANNKGGVGKTTSNIMLASRLIEKGYKVLLVDLEFPGYMSRFFNEKTSLSTNPSIMSLFRDGEPKEPLKINENLSLYQTYDELANVDAMGLDAVINFKSNIKAVSEAYDFVVIDTPPLLNNRLDCALNACDKVICVVIPREYSVDGMGSFLKQYKKIKSFSNPNLPKFPFVFFNMVMGTNPDHAKVIDEFLDIYSSDYITRNYLKNRKAIEDSIHNGQTVWNFKTKRFIKDEALAVFDNLIQYLEE